MIHISLKSLHINLSITDEHHVNKAHISQLKTNSYEKFETAPCINQELEKRNKLDRSVMETDSDGTYLSNHDPFIVLPRLSHPDVKFANFEFQRRSK